MKQTKVVKLWIYRKHCMKSVHIRSFSGQCFPAFGLNMERYDLSVCSPNAGKYGPEKLRMRHFLGSEILIKIETFL